MSGDLLKHELLKPARVEIGQSLVNANGEDFDPVPKNVSV
jgi:hypothetical protein